MMRDEIQKRTFERIYGAEFLASPEDPPVSGLVEALLLKPDSVVVEFGAGQGRYTLPIAKKFWKSSGNGLIFAFDYSEAMIKTLDDAAAILGVDDYIRSWPLEQMKEPDTLPVNDGKVDRVLAVNSAQYLEDPIPMLTEFARVLRPGGFALIADWSRPFGKPIEEGRDEESSAQEMVRKMRKVGFGTCAQINIDGYDWAVRAVKPVSLGGNQR
jgi:ubiquinone/menaquinone biosynthesis C-methylase UbiE